MARKTVLVCDNCGKEVEEGKGAVLRLTFTDARRGAKQADLCDDCAGTDARSPCSASRPSAEGSRSGLTAFFLALSGSAPGSRRDPGLGWIGGPQPARRARQRGQSRAPFGAVSRRPGDGRAWKPARPHRAEPIGRRARRAGSPRAEPRAPRRLDRDVRRRLCPDRARRRGPARAFGRRAQPARPADRRRCLAERPRALRALRRASPTRSLQPSRELESGLVDPEALDGDLARLYASYRAELDRLGRWDRDGLRRHAVERLQTDFDAWHGEPVFAYGFEDLTGAEWELLRALAGRTEVTVSLPYEAGRAAFESLRPTMDDLSALSDGRIETLPARREEARGAVPGPGPAHPALAHLERSLFVDGDRGGAAARGRRSLLRGRGHARDPRARCAGDPRPRSRRHGTGADRRSSAPRSSAGVRRSRPGSAGSASRSRSR